MQRITSLRFFSLFRASNTRLHKSNLSQHWIRLTFKYVAESTTFTFFEGYN